jgi:hypothetical protein
MNTLWQATPNQFPGVRVKGGHQLFEMSIALEVQYQGETYGIPARVEGDPQTSLPLSGCEVVYRVRSCENLVRNSEVLRVRLV